MATMRSQRKRSRPKLASLSPTEEPQGTCSDFLFDLSIDLDEVTGAIAVMSQLGVGRNRNCGTEVDTEDLCACLRLLEGRLSGIRARVYDALEGTDHEHHSASTGQGKKTGDRGGLTHRSKH